MLQLSTIQDLKLRIKSLKLLRFLCDSPSRNQHGRVTWSITRTHSKLCIFHILPTFPESGWWIGLQYYHKVCVDKARIHLYLVNFWLAFYFLLLKAFALIRYAWAILIVYVWVLQECKLSWCMFVTLCLIEYDVSVLFPSRTQFSGHWALSAGIAQCQPQCKNI